MNMTHKSVAAWVAEMADLTKPDKVVWLDGSEQEYAGLLAAGG